MNAAAEHSIVVLEQPGGPGPDGAISCVLGSELRFDRGALERCSSTPLEEIDVDLLVVLASIAFADRRVSRRRGSRWGRALALSVPVYLPAEWERVASKLASLLLDVSGDAWRLEFSRRTAADELRQLFLPQLPREFRGATVAPYSGGLDSFATVAHHRVQNDGTPLLLVHARHGARSLHSVLLDHDRSASALAVPFTVSGGPHAEASYRTRTLVFFSLAALAWRRNNASRIWIGESGIGCLGPSFVPFGIEQPVCGCHPMFIKKLGTFFEHLWGVLPPFELPHLWVTKGEVLAELRSREALEGWQRTHSCSRNIRRQHPMASASHCGLCSGCMFRRQSLRAAGLAEGAGTYYCDVLADADLPADAQPADREVGTYAAVNLDELARVAAKLSNYRGHMLETARSVGRPSAEVETKLGRLFARHAEEWSAFVNAVPAGSWLRQVVTSEQGPGEPWIQQS
jgi:7-cyano-7-deazaguanine synthase in queuosine biosynthesis